MLAVWTYWIVGANYHTKYRENICQIDSWAECDNPIDIKSLSNLIVDIKTLSTLSINLIRTDVVVTAVYKKY